LITAFTKSGQLHPEFQQKFMSVITDRDTPIMLYCRTGNRTTDLGKALVDQLGFANVSHLSKGITGWQKAQKPVQSYKASQ
jgi:rhodanese-related sulfurtransferase